MSFFLLQAYLFLIYMRPQDWASLPHIRFLPLMDYVMGLLLASLVVEALAVRHRVVKTPHNWMVMWVWLAIAASHVHHTYLGGAIEAFVTFGKIAILYFVIVNTVTSERKMKITLMWLTVLTVLMAWQGVDQYYDWRGKGWAWQPMTIDNRISWVGVFADPNDLALAFVVVVPILLGYIFRRSNFLGKLPPVAFTALVFYALYLTNSRGAYVGLMVAIYFFFLKRSRHFVVGSIVGGAMGALAFTFGPSRLGMIAAQDASAYGRLNAWYHGFQLLKDNPIFGAGYGMFTDDFPLTAHNSFMLAAAELGMFGLFCWIGLLYVCYKGLERVSKLVPSLSAHATGLQAGLIGYLATGFFISRTYTTVLYLLCGLCAALYAIGVQKHPEVGMKFTFKDGMNVMWLSVASMVLVQFAMKTWL